MKTLASLLFLLGAMSVHARVITVSNNPAFPGQHPDVQAAIAAAAAGDTIFVHGSQFTYPDFIVSKRLVVIGAGYGSNNQFNQATRVNTISLIRDTGLQNGSGSVIVGFLVQSNIQLTGSLDVNNISVSRCYVAGQIFTYNPFVGASTCGSNWTFFNNIINKLSGGSSGYLTPSSGNITIQNNFFFQGGGIDAFSMNSVLINHNVFIGGNSLTNLFYATITNNIFVMTTGNVMASSVYFNTFNNNLSLLTTISPSAPTNSFLTGPNSGAGNLVGTDPQFVAAPSYAAFSGSYDYRLKTASAGHNTGTDGTDLGVYGGAYPFPSGGTPGSGWDTSPTPPIPQVTEVNIQNAVVQPGTPLNVNVKAKVNN